MDEETFKKTCIKEKEKGKHPPAFYYYGGTWVTQFMLR